MSKIDSKLEKIIEAYFSDREMYNRNLEKKGFPNPKSYWITEIKHLILSEIKKVEPEKISLPETGIYNEEELNIRLKVMVAFNEAITQYYKALEELLK